MTIKEQIEKDIKTAMLAGDKTLVTTLRGLKSVILYAEVSAGSRQEGLEDAAVTTLLQKEAKKRQESSELFARGGNSEKAAAEAVEKEVISRYLPAQMSEDEISSLVVSKAKELGLNSPQQMGQLIGAVKQVAGAGADGSLIAKLAREQLNQ